MSWDPSEGGWNELTGKVEGSWSKLTDDEMAAVALRRDQLLGLLKNYGYEKEQAEYELDKFSRGLGSNVATAETT